MPTTHLLLVYKRTNISKQNEKEQIANPPEIAPYSVSSVQEIDIVLADAKSNRKSEQT